MPWIILGIAGLAGLFFFARRDDSPRETAPTRRGRESAPTAPDTSAVKGTVQFKGLTLDRIAENVAMVFKVAKGNQPQAIHDVSAGFRQMPSDYREYVGKKAVELGAPAEGIHMALLASHASSGSRS